MLDISKVLSRSWHILWKYRILWVFGFFLAMAAGGSGGPNFNWTQPANREFPGGPWNMGHFPGMFGMSSEQTTTMWIVVGIVALVVILFWSVVSAFLKYISETATIRAVNDYEDTGIKSGFKQLFKAGWSKTSWRLFLINLLLSLPMILLVILLGGLGAWTYFAIQGGSDAFAVFSTITAVGLGLLALLFFMLLAVALGVIGRFAARICVLEGSGVIDSIKQGYAMIRRNLKQVFFMWLVMVGIGIAWAIASFMLILPLLFVMVFTVIPGILAGGIPGLIAAGFAALFQAPTPWYWIIGGIVALPLFFLVTFSPMILVSGWQQIFNTSVWTETYRELKAYETVKPAKILPLQPVKPAPRKVAVKPVAAKPAPRTGAVKTATRTVKPKSSTK